MKKKTQKQLYIAGSALLVLLFFVFLCYINLLSHWHYQANIIKQKLTEQSKQTNFDLHNYLAPLSKRFDGESCSPQVLQAMREAQYYAEKLHEFSLVVDNQLICTANLGPLENPIEQPVPDIFDPQSNVSFTRLAPIGILPGNDKAVRLRVGNFQALLKINSQSMLASLGLQAVIFVYDGERFLKAYTNQYDWLTPLSSKPHTDTISRLQNGKWLQQFCYAPQTCALLKIDIKTFLKRHALLLSLSTLIIFGLCIAIFAKCYREIQTYFSFDAQVKRGVNQNQVICYYQPIIDNTSGKVSSCEVLCRWRDKGGDLHGAFPFIEAVINNGQEAELTSVIVKNAIEDFKHHGLLGKTKLSINCFPNDVANGHIKAALIASVPRKFLNTIVIEITEQQSSKGCNIHAAISELRELGVKIAIDDFGTGYSNLEQLKDLKVDYLKIDQGFIFDILDNKLHRQLVELILNLADEMNLCCVAEGVETAKHQAWMPQLNIQFSQGYFHAKPMPIDELSDYLGYLNKSV